MSLEVKRVEIEVHFGLFTPQIHLLFILHSYASPSVGSYTDSRPAVSIVDRTCREIVKQSVFLLRQPT